MINIKNIINEHLKKERPVFHSEDDLKFSLSTAILKIHPKYNIRLERPVEIKMVKRDGKTSVARAPIDIVIIDEENNSIPIEIKYKTTKEVLNFNNEEYRLLNHGACDIGRYSFRKDIFRVEQYIRESTSSKLGFVLIITNDKSYYDEDVSNKNKIDKNFSFHNKMSISQADDSWNYNKINLTKYERDPNDNQWKSKGTQKKHWTCSKELFYLLNLENEYEIIWEDYSKIGKSNFKFCLIKIPNNSL